MAVLVEQEVLHQALEDDEGVSRRIALVVNDLLLFELPYGHVRGELVSIDLGQDLERKDVTERRGHTAELFKLHGRESLGAR